MTAENPFNSKGGNNGERPKIDKDVLAKFFNSRNEMKDRIPDIGEEERIDKERGKIEDESVDLEKGFERGGRQKNKNRRTKPEREENPEKVKNKSPRKSGDKTFAPEISEPAILKEAIKSEKDNNLAQKIEILEANLDSFLEYDAPGLKQILNDVALLIKDAEEQKAAEDLQNRLRKAYHTLSMRYTELIEKEKQKPQDKKFIKPIDLRRLYPDELEYKLNQIDTDSLVAALEKLNSDLKNQLSKMNLEDLKQELLRISSIRSIISKRMFDVSEKDTMFSKFKDERWEEKFVKNEEYHKLAKELSNLRSLYTTIHEEFEKKSPRPSPEQPSVPDTQTQKGKTEPEVKVETKEKPEAEEKLLREEKIKQKQKEIEKAEEKMAIYRPLGWLRKKPVVRDLGYYAKASELDKLKKELKELKSEKIIFKDTAKEIIKEEKVRKTKSEIKRIEKRLNQIPGAIRAGGVLNQSKLEKEQRQLGKSKKKLEKILRKMQRPKRKKFLGIF
jgi:hypothetical protein